MNGFLVLHHWHSEEPQRYVPNKSGIDIAKVFSADGRPQKSIATICNQSSRQYLKTDVDHRCARNARCRKCQRKGHFSVVC